MAVPDAQQSSSKLHRSNPPHKPQFSSTSYLPLGRGAENLGPNRVYLDRYVASWPKGLKVLDKWICIAETRFPFDNKRLCHLRQNCRNNSQHNFSLLGALAPCRLTARGIPQRSYSQEGLLSIPSTSEFDTVHQLFHGSSSPMDDIRASQKVFAVRHYGPTYSSSTFRCKEYIKRR